MKSTPKQVYNKLREGGGSISDFPNILGGGLYRSLIKIAEAQPQEWKKIAKITTLTDFRTHQRLALSGLPLMEKLGEKDREPAGYNSKPIKENYYNIQGDTWGNGFTITRKMVINDDLQAFADIKMLMLNSYMATMRSRIKTLLEGDSQTYYSSTRLFRDGTNKGTTSLADSAAGRAAVEAACTWIRTSTDPQTSRICGLVPKYLVVAGDLERTAKAIVSATNVYPVSTTGGGNANTLGDLEVVVIPELTSGTWYVFADPSMMPAIEIAFLNGKEMPDILVSKAEMVNVVGGGDDPYSYQFDDINYKMRHDWGEATPFYQGVYRGK